jgi:hypothetical protein
MLFIKFSTLFVFFLKLFVNNSQYFPL